jgi:hypothetical protein
MQYTFHTLEHWFKSIYEKFGWMILATHEQNIDKVEHYLKSIKHLINCIDDKIKITVDTDRINDLKILKQQTIYLQHFANYTLTNPNNFKF